MGNGKWKMEKDSWFDEDATTADEAKPPKPPSPDKLIGLE